MRLFIAINFTNETKKHLTDIANELRSHSQYGNFSSLENLHLTLAFLGECDEKQTAAVKSVMKSATFEPFDIFIDYVGRFKREGGDIWWAGVRGSEALSDLQHILTHRLIDAGFKLDKRKYSPHITLGREVITNYVPKPVKPFGETAYKIDLMKSERICGRLTYTSIYRRGKWEKPIVVEPYNPNWAAEFERISAYLLPYIGDMIVAIHHVGSTSVDGLSAKPIIDFDIEIASMSIFSKISERLGRLGFRHEGNYGIEGREAFKRESPDEFMDYHMYVCPTGSAELKRHLKFRDYLRGNSTAVNEYIALKTLLSARCGNDIDAYVDGKTEFIQKILEKCEEKKNTF